MGGIERGAGAGGRALEGRKGALEGRPRGDRHCGDIAGGDAGDIAGGGRVYSILGP